MSAVDFISTSLDFRNIFGVGGRQNHTVNGVGHNIKECVMKEIGFRVKVLGKDVISLRFFLL